MLGGSWIGKAPRVDEGVLDALTSITNLALGGYLQPQNCRFRDKLVPLLKKDSDLRQLVVGERLPAIFAKAEAEQVAEEAAALQSLQIGIGRKGPSMQASVTAVRSWIRGLRDGEAVLKIAVRNAYNTISREVCLRVFPQHCQELLRRACWSLHSTKLIGRFCNNFT